MTSGPLFPTSGNMGYRTNYSLNWECDEDKTITVASDRYSNADFLDTLLRDEFLDDVKWYEWESDMIALAKENPDVLFILDGDGEESGDIWEFRIKGNQSEFHRLEMPPFTTLLTKQELKRK